jgi:hypothetical protein
MKAVEVRVQERADIDAAEFALLFEPRVNHAMAP